MKTQKQTDNLMLLIWVQALVSVAGSLYFSEIKGYAPCELCWIQRIGMYPLVIIYGVALLKRDIKIALPGLILSGIGLLFSAYHYLLQKWPAFQQVGDTCGIIPCRTQYINYFGFITIPLLAGIAFSVILGLHIVILKQHRSE